MPAVQVPRDPYPPTQADSLATHLSLLLPREPALDAGSGSAISFNALAERATLERRVVPGIIPTYYNFDGPAPGTVVGIVLGSVAGFILIVWLLYSLTGQGGSKIQGEEEIVVRRHRSRSPRSRRSRRSSRPEVREVSRSPRSAVIVEERRSAPRTRSIIVEERSRVPGDDVVEVIEEDVDYRPRRGSRRGGGYRY